ncbi:MAG TPA: NAD(P)-binding domain-containing protein [Gemmatimonas sp.]|nr:NAD(P)-binding domain-containing protein [Gemmatimonas sp.]
MFTLPFHVVGCSHESTDVGIIGRLAIAEGERAALSRDVLAAGIPCVLLSTCNRTELYWWGPLDAAPIFRAWVTGRLGTVPPRAIERRDADLAVRHLFAVAAGLRSQRLGEPEILGQVRRAWIEARDGGTTVNALDAVFQRGIQAARRIRTRAGEFDWGQSLGDASAAFIGAQLERETLWANQRVLIVGTGAAAESAAIAIARRSPGAMTVISRTDDRAAALAATIGAEARSWENRHEALVGADVVVFATRSKTPVLRGGEACGIMTARAAKPAVWLDLGVPRNVEAGATAAGLQLFALHDLPQDVDVTAEAAAIAHSALQHELARFATELHRRSLAERLPAMESIAGEVARATVQQLRNSIGLSMGVSSAERDLTPELDAAALEVARRMTRLLLREMGATERSAINSRVTIVA